MSLIDLIMTHFGLIVDRWTAISAMAISWIAQDPISFLSRLASLPLLLLTTLKLLNFAVVEQFGVDLHGVEE